MTYDYLEEMYRQGRATMPINRINHREFLLDGVRYKCGWSSRARDKDKLPHVSRYNEITGESYMELAAPYEVEGWSVYDSMPEVEATE